MGKPFTRLIDEWVFTPLQMQRSTFDPLVAMTFPLAQGHSVTGEAMPEVDHRFVDNPAHYPAGFAMSTVLDLANLAMMLLNQGGFRGRAILPPALATLMWTPQINIGEGENRCGLPFLMQEHNGRRLVSHNGAIPHFRAEFALLPDREAGVVILWNTTGGPEMLVRPIFDLFVI